MAERPLNVLDQLTAAADRALRTIAAEPVANRASPAATAPRRDDELDDVQRREAAALCA
jgi:hypothetical protein